MTDRTVSLNSKSRVCLFRSLTLRNTESFLFALRHTSFTWALQSKLEVRINPKCLWELTRSMKVSPNIRGGELLRYLLENLYLFKCLKTKFCHAYSDVFKIGKSWIIYNLQRKIWFYFSLSFHFKESNFLLVHFPPYCRILRLNYKIHGNESKKISPIN